MTLDRFAYSTNIERATSYSQRLSAFWPPADRYALHCVDLSAYAPALSGEFARCLAALRNAIDDEWIKRKEAGKPLHAGFFDPKAVADALRRLGDCLPSTHDRQAVALRAQAVEMGYSADLLAGLAGSDEDITVVAAQLATWYGKEVGGLPTAFACRRSPHQNAIDTANRSLSTLRQYLVQLHADLRLADPPKFSVAELFFMAGEGNLHPKHIAYFLPADEGVKGSPFRRTYYFRNTHRALLERISVPLAARFLSVGPRVDTAITHFELIPVLGVFAHEMGHAVHRPRTSYAALNAKNRWASVLFQEAAADVFGTLILAEVWSGLFRFSSAEVVSYYLAECLRYVDRGLGHFPDSDGMFLQISYLVQLGALTVEQADGVRLVGDPEAVLAGLRSLARVLADAVLGGEADGALALHAAFGPANPAPLQPLIAQLRSSPSSSIEYVQEHVGVSQTRVGIAA